MFFLVVKMSGKTDIEIIAELSLVEKYADDIVKELEKVLDREETTRNALDSIHDCNEEYEIDDVLEKNIPVLYAMTNSVFAKVWGCSSNLFNVIHGIRTIRHELDKRNIKEED